MNAELHARELYISALEHHGATRWAEAGAGFAAAYRASPGRATPAIAMLDCALQLARAGRQAPTSNDSDRGHAEGLISFVVCSIRPDRLARLRGDLEKHLPNDDWELVHVSDARSLCEGYTRGLQHARGEYIVFCHDDIGILCDRFAARLRGHLARHDLIGVAGCDRLSGPIWSWAGAPHTACWVCPEPSAREHRIGMLGSKGSLLENAQALDGVFLAGRRHVFERVGFDAQTFDGFHFYDLDFSYRAHRAGFNCAAALDLVLWHASGGAFNSAEWQKYAERFVTKFPELEPVAPQAPFRPGSIVIDDIRLAAPIYNWIAHWQSLP
jgi:hypothetical protein